MARIKKGIRSRDALRVPFASLTTPFVCPAEPGRPPRLAPRRPRCARVLIAARALSGGRGRPSRSLLTTTPAGCPIRRGLCPDRCSALRACGPLRGGCSLAPNHCCRCVLPAWFAPLARASATGGAGLPGGPALLRSAGTAVVSPPPGNRSCLWAGVWGQLARCPVRCDPVEKDVPTPLFRWPVDPAAGAVTDPGIRMPPRDSALLLRSGSVQTPAAGESGGLGDGARGVVVRVCGGVICRK